MRAQVEILQQLRLLDSGIETARATLGAIEGDRQRSAAEEALVREALDREKAKLGETVRRRRGAEQEIRTWTERQLQYQRQMSEARNNIEFQAFLRQISDAKARISEWEDAVLTALEEEEAAQRNIVRMDSEMAVKQKASGQERARLERERALSEERIAGLSAQRAACIGRLDPQVRNRYERLRAARGENVIVAVAGGACGGCHYRLPPQVANLVRKGEDLVFCEGCGRMLVHAGEMDPEQR